MSVDNFGTVGLLSTNPIGWAIGIGSALRSAFAPRPGISVGGGVTLRTVNPDWQPDSGYTDTGYGGSYEYTAPPSGDVAAPFVPPDVVAELPTRPPGVIDMPGQPPGEIYRPGPTPGAPGTPGTYPDVYRPPQGPPVGGPRLPTLPEAIGALSRIGGMIGGLLYPTDTAATDTVLKGKKKGARRRDPRDWRFKEPKIKGTFNYGYVKQPRLPALMGEDPLPKPKTAKPPKLRPIKTTARRLPTAVPSPTATPSLPGSASLPAPSLPSRLLDLLQPILIAAATPRPRSASPLASLAAPVSTITPLAPLEPPTTINNYSNPLTTYNTTALGFAQPGSGSGGARTPTRTLEDQCRQIRKSRKPRRKCVERDDCNKCVRYSPI